MFDATPPGINKVCCVADARHPRWQAGYRDLGFPSDTARFHRKIWEFNQTLYGLRTLRRLAPDAVASASVAGTKSCLLSGQPRRQSRGYRPLPGRIHRRRERRRCPRAAHECLSLDAAESTFDFAFCLSSIGHFGSINDKHKALREMFRALKPGGVAVVTTEVVLNRLGRGRQYFAASQ